MADLAYYAASVDGNLRKWVNLENFLKQKVVMSLIAFNEGNYHSI
jgi:hypothetical protein